MLLFQVILSLASSFLKLFIIKGEGVSLRANGIRGQQLLSEWQPTRDTVWLMTANTAK